MSLSPVCPICGHADHAPCRTCRGPTTDLLRARLWLLVNEAERAFEKAPKALWTTRTYLSRKDCAALRAYLVDTRAALRQAAPMEEG